MRKRGQKTREQKIGWLPVGILTGALLMLPAVLGATTYNVVIDSTALSGTPATLFFDFVDGGPPDNSVFLSTLTNDWILAVPPSSDDPPGSVLGAGGPGPWTFTDSSGAALDYRLFVDFTQAGTSLSFSFTTTDNAPDFGSSPDSFALFVVDTDHVTPLIATDEINGTNALFLVSLGQGTEGLQVFKPILGPGEIFSISVTPVQGAPEPSTLALLAVGFAAMFRRRRYR